jgi:hypothetical protein
VMPPAKFLAVRDGVYSAVNRLIPREALARNGTPFTNMQSTHNVKIICWSNYSIVGLSGIVCVDGVEPFFFKKEVVINVVSDIVS